MRTPLELALTIADIPPLELDLATIGTLDLALAINAENGDGEDPIPPLALILALTLADLLALILALAQLGLELNLIHILEELMLLGDIPLNLDFCFVLLSTINSLCMFYFVSESLRS